jgi:NosR/NirI family transcriptional regulator, nitrous oxide reductase regulator
LKKLVHISLKIFLILTAFPNNVLSQQQRFPKPEFETGYQIPETTAPEPRAQFMEFVDVFFLLAVLAIAIWFIFKKRSRKGILWLSVFALLYFGFYREGCICAIGAVQNVTLALFNTGYAIPITALAFFVVPLLLTLFAGRIFCGSACPLGIIQDVVIVKPIKVAPWLQKTLGVFPFIYLGFAVLYAATATDFIICRYDPFIGIFRLGADFHMILLGVGFLLLGMFVARPYCRFVCPFGALLKIGSTFSKNHLSITPTDCINCKLCKDSCPFDAIDYPTDEKDLMPAKSEYRKFLIYTVLLPVFVFFGGWTVSGAYKILSKAHPDVALANLLVADPQRMNDTGNVDIKTFMSSERTLDMLVADAAEIQKSFRKGGWWLGGFIGLVIALTLLNQVIFRKRTIYEANKGNCLSCARCMDYCPVGKPEHSFHHEDVVIHSSEEKTSQLQEQ